MRRASGFALGVLLVSGCDKTTTPDPVPSPVAAPTAAPNPTPAPTPPPLSVTGEWRSEARSWDIRLEHSGSSIRGALLGFKNERYSNSGHHDLQITGTVSGSGAVEFQAAAFDLSFSGTVEADGARMTGTLHDCAGSCRNYGEVLTRK